jgi:hypothetical protein
MPGQHWGERDGKRSARENVVVGIGSTLLAIGQFGVLLLLASGLLQADSTKSERPSPQVVRSSSTIIASARQQCKATTKRGARCSRMGATGKATCWQH